MNALEFKNVRFGYPDGSTVLDGASFHVGEGEFVALVGDNGSGKTTIAKMADAFLLPQEGSVNILGRNLADVSREGADALLDLLCGIGFVQQNPDEQFVATLVIDEVAFGPSGLGLHRDEVTSRVEDALREVGALDLEYHDVNCLSGGQKQRIAIADAIAMNPRLLILDEPTSMLDGEGRAAIMNVVSQLHAKGMAILLVTHSAEEASCADRVIKVEDGQVFECEDFAKEQSDEFEAIVGSIGPITSLTGSIAKTPDLTERPAIEFKHASFEYPASETANSLFGGRVSSTPVVADLDLQVNEGELVCLSGPNGCGKSTLLRMMIGLLKPTEGEVLVFGEPTSSKQGANAARRNVGLCFQNPERTFFCQTVLDEASFGPRNMGFSESESREMAIDALKSVGILSDADFGSSPFELSGGMQRRLALASILSMQPRVLAMDEPCAGLDARSHAQFVSLMLDLKKSGQTIVLVTHDKRDIGILADRVIEL